MPSSIFGGRGEPVAAGRLMSHAAVRVPACSEKAKVNKKNKRHLLQ